MILVSDTEPLVVISFNAGTEGSTIVPTNDLPSQMIGSLLVPLRRRCSASLDLAFSAALSKADRSDFGMPSATVWAKVLLVAAFSALELLAWLLRLEQEQQGWR